MAKLTCEKQKFRIVRTSTVYCSLLVKTKIRKMRKIAFLSNPLTFDALAATGRTRTDAGG